MPSRGYIVLGPKYTPKFFRMLVMILYPCMGFTLKNWSMTRSRRPLISLIWTSLSFCLILFSFLYSCFTVLPFYSYTICPFPDILCILYYTKRDIKVLATTQHKEAYHSIPKPCKKLDNLNKQKHPTIK